MALKFEGKGYKFYGANKSAKSFKMGWNGFTI